ncbi:MAG: hypothetical protein IJA45_00485 [Oscillospiraceae bacterium]|nr:hypothetical protein [Oscillospiraceae bacterium]
MKKRLLKWAVIFHAIMYSVSLLDIGYKFGETALLPYPNGLDLFIYPAADLILLLVGLSLYHNREYGKSRSYLKWGIVTLVFGSWKLGSRLFFHYLGMISKYMDYYVLPMVTFCLYFIISIFYFLCTIITWKEDRSAY